MRELLLARPLNALNELEAVILDNPSLGFHSLNINITPRHYASVMLFQGSRQALQQFKSRYVRKPPERVTAIEVLSEERGSLVVYEVEAADANPLDITGLIRTKLGPDAIPRVSKTAREARWRILIFHQEHLGRFMKAVRARGQYVVERSPRPVDWYELRGWGLPSPKADAAREELAPLDLAVMEAAMRLGYYRSPRACRIADVARELRMPATTLHYHLAKSEAEAVRRLVASARGRHDERHG